MAQPGRAGRLHSRVPLLGPLLGEPWVAFAMSWAGAAYDLGIVAALLCARTRPLAYAMVVVFHVATALLFPIGLFPWLMVVATTVAPDGADPAPDIVR